MADNVYFAANKGGYNAHAQQRSSARDAGFLPHNFNNVEAFSTSNEQKISVYGKLGMCSFSVDNHILFHILPVNSPLINPG